MNVPNFDFPSVGIEGLDRSGNARKLSRRKLRCRLNSTAIYLHFPWDPAQTDPVRRLAEALAQCGVYARESNIPFSKNDITQIDADPSSSPEQPRLGLERLRQLVEVGRVGRIIVPSVKQFGSDPTVRTSIVEAFFACGAKLYSIEAGEILPDIVGRQLSDASASLQRATGSVHRHASRWSREDLVTWCRPTDRGALHHEAELRRSGLTDPVFARLRS